jgi:Protein of unknown function (DUF550)
MRQPDGTKTLDMFDTAPNRFPVDDVDRLAFEVFFWAESTFPNRTDASMFLKIYEEVAEVIRSDGEPMEVADLFILLLDYVVRKDIVLSEAVRQKLAINKKRSWKINPDGTMSHKEE